MQSLEGSAGRVRGTGGRLYQPHASDAPVAMHEPPSDNGRASWRSENMRGVAGVEIGYETIRLACDDTGPIGPQLHVLRAGDAVAVAENVERAGGRVLRVRDDVLVVELPLAVSPASVGAAEVQVRELSTDERGVIATWQPVAAAS